jgi:hypothetical protein
VLSSPPDHDEIAQRDERARGDLLDRNRLASYRGYSASFVTVTIAGGSVHENLKAQEQSYARGGNGWGG